MKLAGKVALVTGAGTGIGRAAALAFARAGAHVAVNYRSSREAAIEVVEAIQAEGGTAIAVAADVAIDAHVKAMIRLVAERFGGLDYLINNAGWSTRIPHHNLDELTDEIWERTLSTNLHGAFYCVRAAVPLLRLRPGAGIVNIASVAGLGGMGSSVAYAASKGAMITMTKSLARALAPQIRVNAVAPGFIRTRFAGWPDASFDQAEAITPLGKLATVDDVAATALFLAADATALTGEVICVDGGMIQLGPRS